MREHKNKKAAGGGIVCIRCGYKNRKNLNTLNNLNEDGRSKET